MRKRDVVGRRIVDVIYARVRENGRDRDTIVVSALVLDNGRQLRPFGFETEDCPDATLVLTRRGA